MALTPANAWPYPGPNDGPDVPYWAQRQAEKGDGLETRVIATEKAARGLLYHQANTAASGPVTDLAVVNNVPSFAFKAGRRYRIKWDYTAYTTTTDTYALLSIQTCATTDAAGITTGMTSLQGRTTSGGRIANLIFHDSVEAIYKPPADATLQLKFTANRNSGTGSIVVTGTSEPVNYTIEDLGAQAVLP